MWESGLTTVQLKWDPPVEQGTFNEEGKQKWQPPYLAYSLLALGQIH